jgi:hypothetical protein
VGTLWPPFSGRSSRAEQNGMAGSRKFLAEFDNFLNMPVERMFSVGLVKAVKTVRPGNDEPDRAELSQFILDRVKRQMTLQH